MHSDVRLESRISSCGTPGAQYQCATLDRQAMRVPDRDESRFWYVLDSHYRP